MKMRFLLRLMTLPIRIIINQNHHHGVCVYLLDCSFPFGSILWYSFGLAWTSWADCADILRPQCADSFHVGDSGQSHWLADDRGQSVVCSLFCPKISEFFIDDEMGRTFLCAPVFLFQLLQNVFKAHAVIEKFINFF